MSTNQVRLTLLITARYEPTTIGAALDAFLAQNLPEDCEILAVCPDDETAAIIAVYAARDARVRHLRDPGRGKPAALNLAQDCIRGEVVILSDGDVYVGAGAVPALMAALADPKVGIVSGRPESLNPRDNMLGYWSHVLVDAAAHRQRELRAQRGQFIECSGYLYAVRRALLRSIPEDTLAEDGLISYRVWEQGFRTAYAPEALVYVKYPTSYRDWLKQKVRSAGGYAQEYLKDAPGMRSLRREALWGTYEALRYARNPKELWWTLLLFAGRLHLWLRVWWDIRVRRRPFADLWQPVNSTK